MDVLWKEAAVSASMKRQIVTLKRRVFEKHLEVDTKAKKTDRQRKNQNDCTKVECPRKRTTKALHSKDLD